jgi:HEAT repeat protein
VATVVVENHLSDASPLVRLAAIRGVARRNPTRARPLLVAMLKDPSVGRLLREDAQRTLTELNSGEGDRGRT